MPELWERPITQLYREVEVMTANQKYVSSFDQERLTEGIALRAAEINRRNQPVRPEIAALKEVWENLTDAERQELIAWIGARR